MSNIPPLVTVILPHYRCERFLADAVSSILRQTWQDLQLVVVDDASSTDHWREVLDPFAQDPRLGLYRTSSTVGPYRIANRIIATIDTALVAFQDADDVSHPTRIEHELDLLYSTPADIVGCRFDYIDEAGRRLSRLRWTHALFRRDIRLNRLAHHPASVVRRSVYETLGGYDGTTRFGADTDFMLRASHMFRIHNSSRILYSLRLREASLTNNPITGAGSPLRRRYKSELRHRAREWTRLAGSAGAAPALRAKPNDVEFELSRVL
jgi:glycosyltransferase involved in cell wall biosynthesis